MESRISQQEKKKDKTSMSESSVIFGCLSTFVGTTPATVNPSAWGHLNPSSYCDVRRLFYGVFKLWSKLQRKK